MIFGDWTMTLAGVGAEKMAGQTDVSKSSKKWRLLNMDIMWT